MLSWVPLLPEITSNQRRSQEYSIYFIIKDSLGAPKSVHPYAQSHTHTHLNVWEKEWNNGILPIIAHLKYKLLNQQRRTTNVNNWYSFFLLKKRFRSYILIVSFQVTYAHTRAYLTFEWVPKLSSLLRYQYLIFLNDVTGTWMEWAKAKTFADF